MLNKKDIQLLSQHSDLTKNQIDFLLKENVYHKPKDWSRFLHFFTLSIGISFLSIAILFFFAYNWQDLHRFLKLGIIELLIVITTLLAVKFSDNKIVLSYILLTSATLIVGVLFAVFGQIYQTGANAFDFFLGWTIAVFIWVISTKFEPLWLLFIALINMTFFMYVEQLADHWKNDQIQFVLLLINLPVLLFFEQLKTKIHPKSWFLYSLRFYLVFIGTIAISQGIFNTTTNYYWINLILTILAFAWFIQLAIKEKSTFYIALIASSFIVIVNFLIFKWLHNTSKFFFAGIFTIISVTLLIKLILTLNKRWKDAK